MVIMMMFNILTCLTFSNIHDNDYHDDNDDDHDYVNVSTAMRSRRAGDGDHYGGLVVSDTLVF